MSIIDIGTTAYIANETTTLVFGTNAYNWLTDGWLGRRASGATDNSYEISLYELVTGALGMDAYPGSSTGTYGVSTSTSSHGSNTSGYALNVIKNNLKNNGGKLFGTVVAAPIIAKVAKKALAKPLINPINRAFKQFGISQALGVKL